MKVLAILALILSLGFAAVPRGPTAMAQESPDDPCAHIETMTIQWFCTLDLEWPADNNNEDTSQ